MMIFQQFAGSGMKPQRKLFIEADQNMTQGYGQHKK